MHNSFCIMNPNRLDNRIGTQFGDAVGQLWTQFFPRSGENDPILPSERRTILRKTVRFSFINQRSDTGILQTNDLPRYRIYISPSFNGPSIRRNLSMVPEGQAVMGSDPGNG